MVALGSIRFVYLSGNQFPPGDGLLSLTREAFLRAKVVRSSQISTRPGELFQFLKILPQELQDLDISSNQIQAEQIEALLKALPTGLRALEIQGNDLGMKGFELVDAYKKQKEDQVGIPFDLSR